MYSLFKNVRLQNMLLLCRLCIETASESEFLLKKYNDYGEYYSEAFRFLNILGIISKDSIRHQYIGPSILGSERGMLDSELTNIIFERMLTWESEIRERVSAYLSNYINVDEKYVYKPSNAVRNRQSDIRNLLIEFDALRYWEKSKTYCLSPNIIPYIVYHIRNTNISAEQFENIQKSRKLCGYNAELVVLEYERMKLSQYKNLSVEQISQVNVGAGYDIKSWDVSAGEAIEKYIEVKAVSKSKMEFYWSRNEVEVSKLLGDSYYLYLLPVARESKFDIDGLIQLRNPYNNVLHNNDWLSEVELYHLKARL